MDEVIDFVGMGVGLDTLAGVFCVAVGIVCLPHDRVRKGLNRVFHVSVDVVLIVAGVLMVVTA